MMPRRRGMMGFPGRPLEDIQGAWQKALKASSSGQRTLYIHIPFCKSRCSFCPFYFGPAKKGEAKEYVKKLAKELSTWADANGIREYPINAVYFGGGTPSDLGPEDFKKILSVLHKKYKLCNDCEITVEGRVAGFTFDKMKACIDNGVNRFSIGVQTFDTALRRSLGRTSSKSEVILMLEKLLSFNQAAVVIDLLYGLPGQTLDSWLEDNRIILEDLPISGLDHYKLNIHRGLPLFEAVDSGRIVIPSNKECFEMYKAGEDFMRDAGAVRISISHYALDYRERNANNDISGRKKTCLPFGVHAGGRLGKCFFHQTNDLSAYRTMVSEGLKPLASASEMPPDYNVCSELAGQISRRMGINMQRAAARDPEHADRILEACGPLLETWRGKGLLYGGQLGFLRLSREAMFRYKELASELMETVASAYDIKEGI